LVAAVAVGILPGAHDRLLGDLVDVATAAAIALGLFENLLVARVRRYPTFDSWHGWLPLCVRKHRADVRVIRRVNPGRTAQLALALGGLLGEDVTQVGLRALELAAAERLEALGRAALRLELGHDCSFV